MRNTLKILTVLLLVPLPAIHATDTPKPGDAVTPPPGMPATVTEQTLQDGSIEPKNSIEQWRALGYGMFIHFGMATYTGRANENDPLNANAPSTLYAPTHLDVDQWIRVAHDAGMKYAVLTSKHSIGHCLWDSKVQFRGKEFDFDVATSGNKTDVVAEFVKACQKYGLMPGLYWCLEDYRNNSKPHGTQRKPPLPDDFFQLAQDQLTELIKLYPAVSYYWIDIPAGANAMQLRTLYDLIKQQRPGTTVLFNRGISKPKKPFSLVDDFKSVWPTDVMNTEINPLQPGWYIPEQIGQDGKTYTLGYEHCDKISGKWFFAEGDRPRPVADLVKLYQNVRATGGNLLLNVPPDPTGRIPEFHIKTLMELRNEIK